MSYLLQKCKKLGVTTVFVSEIKRVEKFPDFEKNGARNSALAKRVYTELKNIDGESSEANDLSHIW